MNRVAVCIGPGGFSGIRTGVAAGRGIGLAARIPVVGATSFRIMAAAFEKAAEVPETYGLAAPAGMNAIYCQIVARGGTPVTNIMALPQSECGAFFEGKAEVLAGPAAAALSEAGFVSLPVTAPDLYPDAVTLAELATSLDPERDAPSPYYVREADAKPQTKHVIALKPIEGAPASILEATAADAQDLAALCAEALPPGWPRMNSPPPVAMQTGPY